MNNNTDYEEMFECKMFITDLETEKNSKDIDIQDLIFDDYTKFEFGEYEDEDYSQLPYKDFKYFINDYSVTIYSPQYHKAKQEIQRLQNIIDKTTNYYLKTLSKNGSMPDEAVGMFNLLKGNKR